MPTALTSSSSGTGPPDMSCLPETYPKNIPALSPCNNLKPESPETLA
ncbi:MAG: hypothetical protein ACK55Z_33075 [bacterium]